MKAAGLCVLQIPSHYEGKLTKMGLHTPTEVQAAAIPQLMAEKNMLLQWVTGSGKTLAYLLPAFAKVDRKVDALQLLVLVPTRELVRSFLYTFHCLRIICHQN